MAENTHVAIRLAKNLTESQMPENKFDVFLNGSDENGVIEIIPMMKSFLSQTKASTGSMCWRERLITRIPLRVLHQEMQQLGLPH